MKRISAYFVALVAAMAMTLTLMGQAPPASASGLVNHSEFNNIYFAERKSEFESRAGVTEFKRLDLATNPDSYIIWYQAIFSDICVFYVEVHVWRGSDGNLYIRPWKQIDKCDGTSVRYNL